MAKPLVPSAYERRFDPGTYYLLLQAEPESSCYSFPPPAYAAVADARCAVGYSDVRALAIEKPVPRFRTRVVTHLFTLATTLTLTAIPLGEDLPYRVCYRRLEKMRCVRGTVHGLDWDLAASDELVVNTRGTARVTTFVWYSRDKEIASRRVRVR